MKENKSRRENIRYRRERIILINKIKNLIVCALSHKKLHF